ncbi:hypothetical protein KEM55_000148, partial [Ascosphaera atra]
MASLADELLNDFEEQSGSEGERGDAQDLLEDGAPTPGLLGLRKSEGPEDVDMGMDGEDEMADEEREYAEKQAAKMAKEAGVGATPREGEEGEEEEDDKTRIEKMQLAGVADVRSVARLMKSLRPVLE